jgi:hypothetical protein
MNYFDPIRPHRHTSWRTTRDAADSLSFEVRRMRRSSSMNKHVERVAEEAPRDCVRTYPVIGEETVMLVYFNSVGAARYEVRMPLAWVSDQTENRILRQCRAHEEQRIKLVR